jgi:hypothetical protein
MPWCGTPVLSSASACYFTGRFIFTMACTSLIGSGSRLSISPPMTIIFQLFARRYRADVYTRYL